LHTSIFIFIIFLKDLICLLFDVEVVDQFPLLLDVLGCIVKEVVKDHIFEFKTLTLVNSEAESMLENSGHSLFGFLVPHYDDLIAPEFSVTVCATTASILVLEEASIGTLLRRTLSKKNIEK
jgi:hypothetical protein